MSEPISEGQVAKDLQAIAGRLAALASGPPNVALIDAELVEIKVHLRRLAEQNADVKRHLAAALDVRTTPKPPGT